MATSKRWTFTLNNPTPDESAEFIRTQCEEGKGYKYLVFQLETGDQGTPHYQGFVTFDGMRRLAAVKRMLQRAHWEPARGSSPQNKHYCTKPVEGCTCTHCSSGNRVQGPWEYGICPQGSGDRLELKHVKEMIASGKRKRELLDDDDGMRVLAKYPKFVDLCYSLNKPQETEAKEVTLLYGPTGCGKTTHVRRSYSDLWVDSIDGKLWFDGYDSHDYALFDDFSGIPRHFLYTSLTGARSAIKLVQLLRLLHEWVERVPIKCGHVWFTPKEIFITSNIHPRDWYGWEDRESQYPALARRLSRVVCFHSDGERSRILVRGTPGHSNFFSEYPSYGTVERKFDFVFE